MNDLLARKAHERVFDAELIGQGGVVTSRTENVELFDFVELKGGMVGDEEMGQRGLQVDLNVLADRF